MAVGSDFCSILFYLGAGTIGGLVPFYTAAVARADHARRARLEQVGRAPDFSPLEGSYQHHAMYSNPLPEDIAPESPGDASSLWTAGRSSLFGDRRATRSGDILTVVIEIDDRAEISNSSNRSR